MKYLFDLIIDYSRDISCVHVRFHWVLNISGAVGKEELHPIFQDCFCVKRIHLGPTTRLVSSVLLKTFKEKEYGVVLSFLERVKLMFCRSSILHSPISYYIILCRANRDVCLTIEQTTVCAVWYWEKPKHLQEKSTKSVFPTRFDIFCIPTTYYNIRQYTTIFGILTTYYNLRHIFWQFLLFSVLSITQSGNFYNSFWQ